jgi:hypothetical protein
MASSVSFEVKGPSQ